MWCHFRCYGITRSGAASIVDFYCAECSDREKLYERLQVYGHPKPDFTVVDPTEEERQNLKLPIIRRMKEIEILHILLKNLDRAETYYGHLIPKRSAYSRVKSLNQIVAVNTLLVFLREPREQYDLKSGWQWNTSHLCPNSKCVNPKHVSFEPAGVNNGRKVCHKAGVCLVDHSPHPDCIFPGDVMLERP